MLANLASALFEHGRITTTLTKAKRLRPLAEKLITFAKRGDMHARRRVLTVVRRKDVVHQLFTDIGPRYAQRPGGYTRIVKLEPRQGDNASMAVIELITDVVAPVVKSDAARARRVKQARTHDSVAALAGEQAENAQREAPEETDTAENSAIVGKNSDGAEHITAEDAALEKPADEVK